MFSALKNRLQYFRTNTHAIVDGLLQVSESLAGHSEIDEKFTDLCKTTVRLIGCDRCSFFLKNGSAFRARYNYGNPPDIARVFPNFRTSLNDPLVAEAVRKRSYVIVNDALTDPRMNQSTAKTARIQAIVLVALFDSNGQPRGFMSAEYNQNRGRFSDLEGKIVLGMGRLAEALLASAAAAEERTAMARSIESTARLEALARLSAGLAHDLNNRLTVMMGATELLKLNHAGPELESIELAVEASAQLTHRLLQFARGTVDEASDQPLHASHVLRVLEDTLRQFLGQACELQLTIEPDVYIACSQGQFEQIVTNLVINASDASTTGSTVRVTLRISGGEAQLIVSDQGKGISSDDLPHIFEPFFTTKQSEGGIGLGLASVHGIVTALQGQVFVQSDPETEPGTTFTVSLPAILGYASAAAESQPEARQIGPSNILLVDDDGPVREVLAITLTRLGHQVFQAASAQQVLDELQSTTQTWQLLVSDVIMPEMTGFELAEKVWQQHPDMPVLFVSAYRPKNLSDSLLNNPNTAFLSKPFSPRALENKVNQVLGTLQRTARPD